MESLPGSPLLGGERASAPPRIEVPDLYSYFLTPFQDRDETLSSLSTGNINCGPLNNLFQYNCAASNRNTCTFRNDDISPVHMNFSNKIILIMKKKMNRKLHVCQLKIKRKVIIVVENTLVREITSPLEALERDFFEGVIVVTPHRGPCSVLLTFSKISAEQTKDDYNKIMSVSLGSNLP